MNDNTYIEYLFNKRVRRKTDNPQKVHNIYSNKYDNWIKEFLNQNQINEVPLFITCNTLYKLPDTFRINKNSFFVGDSYLFEYFYDWNYVLSDERYQEFIVNLCVKQYIESCYLNNRIDEACWLCLTSNGIEDYKNERYFDKNTITYFVERTHIQEEFTMIHEAGHYLYRFIDKDTETKCIREIHSRLTSVIQMEQFQSEKAKNDDLEEKLFEECYCDAQAVKYILKCFDSDGNINIDEQYEVFFRTLFYIYVLQYIDAMCEEEIENADNLFDYQLWELTYRMANIYNTLYADLLEWGTEIEIKELDNTYTKFVDLLKSKMKEVRQVIYYVKDLICENKNSICVIEELNDADKEQIIKEYLKLL